MRARYCAHELELVDFVVKTYHPSCNAQDERDAIAESIAGNWCLLEVVSCEEGSTLMRALLPSMLTLLKINDATA
ncbi:protein ychJ [Vibrio ishigakensis]|uniref:Protein ychJ n=1 Tax=Vibrio ishigakensis TaxID=1481914 RepID=A0A0B8QHL8_9VIBR|nr:protein ychJ [Vibrio ishigakensis]